MELAIAGLLTRRSLSEALQLKWVLWLAVCFLAYRLARWTGQVMAPCGCLGVLASPAADRLSKAALGWMFGGSTLSLLWPRNRSGSAIGSLMRACSESTRLKVLVLSFGVLSILASTAVGAGVTLSGNVQVNRMRPDGSIWEAYTSFFQVSLRDAEWQMITTDSDDHTEVNSFDGTNLYAFYIPTDKTISRLAREEGVTNPLAAAYISKGPYPFFNAGPATQVLWFALLSAEFLLTTPNDLPSPWAQFGTMELSGHLTRLSSLRFNTGSPRWPVEAQFVYSSRALLGSPTNLAFVSSWMTPEQIKKTGRDARKRDNHAAARYTVLSTTNIGDKTFPSSFELDAFDEKGPPPLKLWTVESFVGTVTNVSGETPEDLVAKPTIGVSVSDFRFSDHKRRIDNLRYSITNGVWPASDDPKLQEEFSKLLASTPIYRPVVLWRVRLIFLVL